MRTTLTIEPAIGARINRLVKKQGRTLKAVINDALREGLRTLENAPKAERKRFVVEAFELGLKTGIDSDKIGQYADETDDIEKLRKSAF